MKKLTRRPGFLAAALAALYLLGVAIGVAFIGLYPIYAQQKPGNMEHARVIAAEYLQGAENEIQIMRSPYTHILIYDAGQGAYVRFVTADQEKSSADLSDYLNRWLPSVLEGRETFAITSSLFSPSLSHIWLTSGVPIRGGEAVAGAVFLIQNLQVVQEAVFAYFLFFTVTYWLSISLLLLYTRKKRNLEELRQNYVANVTHAFKTPIASIRVMAEALCDGVVSDPDRQTVYFGRILQETNNQSRMVQEMLELAKLQSDGVDFTKAAVPPTEIFDPIAERYTVMCDCTDVTLHVEEAIFRLPQLYTNAACIRQVLELLLDNAIKFVPEGGNVWIGASVKKNTATVSVRDNGIGISKEDLPHVFERFYRCSRSDAVGGSGLGLAIVKEVINGLKEKIWVESEPGKGTEFFLRFD